MFEEFKSKTSNHISFGIYGFEFLPNDLTRDLGIEPTEIRIKNEVRLVGKMKHKRENKENAWILKSDLPLTNTLENHLVHLLGKLQPCKQKLINFTKNYYTEFSCALYFRESNPGINLDEKILREISELNAKIDLDMYCLGEDDVLDKPEVRELFAQQLSNVSFIKKLESKEHTESREIAEGLSEIQKYSDELSGIHIWDLFWENLTEREYKERFEKIGEDLQKINKSIKRSKLLSSFINKNLKSK